MFKTALEPNNFTITPTSFEALQEYISLIFPNKSDRGNAIMVAVQAWNLACNIAEQERGALQSEFEDQLRDMREEIDGKISDLSDSLSDLVYQKEALQEEIDAHFLASISILKVKNNTLIFYLVALYIGQAFWPVFFNLNFKDKTK
jgi:hypothetical protein